MVLYGIHTHLYQAMAHTLRLHHLHHQACECSAVQNARTVVYCLSAHLWVANNLPIAIVSIINYDIISSQPLLHSGGDVPAALAKCVPKASTAHHHTLSVA